MRQLLKLVTINLCYVLALYRSRSEQAIVDLAGREPLATFAQKRVRAPRTPSPRLPKTTLPCEAEGDRANRQ